MIKILSKPVGKEVWKDIVGYEVSYRGFYKVSSHGRVARVKGNKIVKILKAGDHKKGYDLYDLSKNGETKSRYGHRLVAKAFLGNPPPGKNLVLHRNDRKKDNKVSNLYWGDIKDNVRDRKRNSLLRKLGKLIGSCKVINIKDDDKKTHNVPIKVWYSEL